MWQTVTKTLILLTKMELSWFLPGASLGPQAKDHTISFLPRASLGPQVKNHTTWFLPRASLSPQVSCVSTKSFVRPTGKIVLLTKMELSRRHSRHKDGVPRHQCHKDRVPRHQCHKDGVPRHQCHKDNGT